MADAKITALPAAAALLADSLFAIVDDPAGSPETQKLTADQLVNFLISEGFGDADTTATLAQFAATTSLQLAGVISDETGTGALVFANTPTLVTPLLGTPTSGVLTNCTGYPVANIAGLAAGIATFLATPSSANLLAAVTNETGTGALVFATGPTIVGATFSAGLGFTGTTIAGLRLNNLTTAERDAIAGPLAGQLIWNTTTGAVNQYTGAAWAAVGGGGGDALTANPLSQFAATTSLQLAGVISDETGTGALVFATSPTLVTPAITTSAVITRNALGVTPTDSAQLINTTAAAAGAQQVSPALRFTGQGWKTTAVAASQAVDVRAYLLPVQGAANPSADFRMDFSVNGGAFANTLSMTITSAGVGTLSVTSFAVSAAGGSVTTGLTGGLILAGSQSRIRSSANGLIELFNNASSDFTRLNFGGITSAFPAIGRNGTLLDITAADGTSTAGLAIYNTRVSSVNYERVEFLWAGNEFSINSEAGSGGGTLRNFHLRFDGQDGITLTNNQVLIGVHLIVEPANDRITFFTDLMTMDDSAGQSLAFFGAPAAPAQQANVLVNNVAAGGTTGQIDDFAGAVYATDGPIIAADIYQLARKLDQIVDGLRTFGLFIDE